MTKHPTKGRTLARDMLEPEEVAALLDACGENDAGIRNRAFIALVTATGLRISEALSLNASGLDLKKKQACVRKRKDQERIVWVHPDALPYLRTWMRLRKKLGLTDSPIFCNMDGARITQSYFRTLIPRLGKLAKIKKRVHADGLRHEFARKAYNAKITQRTIQLQLGHRNIATTVRYMEDLGLHDAFDHFDAAFSG